jgi:DNA-binding transcriptional ArsR family regulator
MPTDVGSDESTLLTPDEAFAVLGHETRLQVLQRLGEACEPLSFSELYEHVEYEDESNFNYHLKQLVGHFVEHTDEGYAIQRPGRRVVKAVLSGAVTENPVIGRSPVETPCFLCGGDEMEVSCRQGTVGVYCPESGGRRDGSTMERVAESATDVVGKVGVPPAGVHDRTPTEVLRVGELWSVRMAQALARDVCPDCSAAVEHSVHVCEDHDPSDGRCDACGQRSAITVTSRCTNCILDQRYNLSALLLADTEVMAFMIEHGIDPLVPRAFHHSSLEETVRTTDPFEARFRFTADGDTLTLTVDEDLSVNEVTSGEVTDAE